MTAIVSAANDTGCPSGLEPPANFDAIDPAPFVRKEKSGERRLELSIHGAHCAACIAKIEGGLLAMAGIETARLNLSTNKLVVAWRGDAVRPHDISRKIASLGYRAAPFDPQAAKFETDREGRFLLRCLAVAGFATANIMLLSVAVWGGGAGEMGVATRGLMHWVSAAIALPAALYAGRPFFSSAIRALRARNANMDVPISLAVILALSVSISETLTHGQYAYFDAAVMLLFFLLIGRYLDHRLRAKAKMAAHELLALQAAAAARLNPDGNVEAVSAHEIEIGDKIILLPGDRAPVNGEIAEGTSNMDVSLVTGESEPVKMKAGDTVYAGVLCISSKIIIRATAKAADSLIADLARLIEAGEQNKSNIVRLADRAAALYVPVVHSLAALTFLGWYFIGDAGLRGAVLNAVAVLIITCPCALGLAAPAVQIVATGRLFKNGILVKSGDALVRLAIVQRIVFDKTGTLTAGKLRIANSGEIPAEELGKAAMLARASRHPFSRAVVAEAGAGGLADEINEIPGLGIEGKIDGEIARFGRADWAGGDAAESSASEAWFSAGKKKPVRFVFADKLKSDAAETIAQLKLRGVEIEILSGDRRGPARRIAEAAGVSNWQYELTPTEKFEYIEKLGRDGIKTAMVGDGLNDAPALAAAYASLSPGSAADASQAAADFVFNGEGLSAVLSAFDISRKARRRVLENFLFAALYNVCAIPLAVFGFVTPLIAAIAMSGSSIIVTLNALRLSDLSVKKRMP